MKIIIAINAFVPSKQCNGGVCFLIYKNITHNLTLCLSHFLKKNKLFSNTFMVKLKLYMQFHHI